MADLDRFSVATLNLYNLQLPGKRMNPGQKPWTREEYDAKLRWTADLLRDQDADVIGLQELWHADALEDVLTRGRIKSRYDVLAEPADGSRIVCAALVRKGLLTGDPSWTDEFPPELRLESSGTDDPQAPEIAVGITGYSRPVLSFGIRLRSDAPEVRVFVVHLKSKRPHQIDSEDWYDKSEHGDHRTAIGAALATIRRTAEAAALRVRLTTEMKGTDTPVIVLGDINDDQHSNTANILTEQPRYLVGDSVGGGDISLYTGQTLQQYRDTRDVYYTHIFQDLRESLDQILVSEQFYDNSRRRLWLFEGLTIDNDHLNPHPGAQDAEASESADHRRRGTADHGLVRMGFRWSPVSAADVGGED